MLGSLSHTVRVFAFMMPIARGVQEDAYVVLGRMLGLSQQVVLHCRSSGGCGNWRSDCWPY
jgi:hypothetical protein